MRYRRTLSRWLLEYHLGAVDEPVLVIALDGVVEIEPEGNQRYVRRSAVTTLASGDSAPCIWNELDAYLA